MLAYAGTPCGRRLNGRPAAYTTAQSGRRLAQQAQSARIPGADRAGRGRLCPGQLWASDTSRRHANDGTRRDPGERNRGQTRWNAPHRRLLRSEDARPPLINTTPMRNLGRSIYDTLVDIDLN